MQFVIKVLNTKSNKAIGWLEDDLFNITNDISNSNHFEANILSDVGNVITDLQSKLNSNILNHHGNDVRPFIGPINNNIYSKHYNNNEIGDIELIPQSINHN